MRRGKEADKKGKNQSFALRLGEQLREDSMADELNEADPFKYSSQIFKELQIDASKCSSSTLQQAGILLTELLQYPSTELAEKHSSANRLGLTDLIEEKPKVQSEVSAKEYQHCEDCGLVVQEESIPLCSSFNSFPNIGVGAFLLFSTIKSLTILLLVLGVTYSGFALYSNISQQAESLSLSNYALKLSYAAIVLNMSADTSLEGVILVESWLLVAVVLIWMAILFFVNYHEIKNKRMVDNNTITAADFSIMIESIPYSTTQEQVQAELDAYYQQLQDKGFIKKTNGSHGHISPFQIKKYCKAVPYHMIEDPQLSEEIQKLSQKVEASKKTFIEWVEHLQQHHQLPLSKQARHRKYAQFRQVVKRREQKENISKFPSQKKGRKGQIEETTVFVTFQRSQSANYIGEVNPQGLSHKISYYLSCCSSALYFDLRRGGRPLGVKVSRAPEPEDVNWDNIGVDWCSIVVRKCLTYLVTGLLLGGSFGIVYGLIQLQQSSNSSILSYAITISITLINVLIGLAIEGLTYYERDFTRTNREISYALKSIVAQLMNSILVPLIANLYIRKNIYLANGLVYQIFFLALTNSLVPPLIEFLNPAHIFNRLLAWFKSRPSYKLKLNQDELNAARELRQFQLGYPYIYYLNSFYFTCFYVTMQPYVVIPTLVGFLLMFWADKYRLLAKSQRPIPSSQLLNDAMGQLVLFSPFMLVLGNLTWFVWINDQSLSNFIRITQLVSLGACAAFYLIPMDSILDACCGIPDDQRLIYDECRAQLASEYDRLNPATKEEGLRIFLEFISSQKNGSGGKDNQQFLFAKLLKKIQKDSPEDDHNNASFSELKRASSPKNNTMITEANMIGQLINFQEHEEEPTKQNLFQEPPTRNRYKSTRTRERPKRAENVSYSIFKDGSKGYSSSKGKGQGQDSSNPYNSLKF